MLSTCGVGKICSISPVVEMIQAVVIVSVNVMNVSRQSCGIFMMVPFSVTE